MLVWLWLALAVFASANAISQTPGQWRYTIATDPANIPADMRVNFPTISFDVCRSADDFASGRAFALQTLASSAVRCPSSGFTRAAQADGRGESLQFIYACDDGKTLTGTADGRVLSTRFSVTLESRYQPTVNGVELVRQTMRGERIGACKVVPNAGEMRVH